MQAVKIAKTSKLFYKKYAYKIEIRIVKSHLIKNSGVDHTINLCDQHLAGHKQIIFKYTNNDDVVKLKEFAKTARKLLESDFKTRAEYNTFNFYLDNKADFNKIIKKLKPWIRTITQPENDEDLAALLDNKKIVLCNKLPLKKYKYRLFLNRKMPPHLREKFAVWAENYKDSIRFSRSTDRWINGVGWMYDPYLYVEESKLLMMLNLFLGENIIKTEEFVLRNTVK